MVPLDGRSQSVHFPSQSILCDVWRKTANCACTFGASRSRLARSVDSRSSRARFSGCGELHKASYLERVADGLRRESAISVASRIVDSHDVVGTLCAAAGEADLVVGLHMEKASFGAWMYGSTVRQLVGKLSVPVIVVGSDGSFSTPPPQRLRRVLIASGWIRAAQSGLWDRLSL